MTDPRSDAGSIARRVLVAVGRWAFEHRWFLVLVVAALVVRLHWNFVVHPLEDYVYSDMRGYMRRANDLFNGWWEPREYDAFYPYGTHVFLYAIQAVAGDEPNNYAPIAFVYALLGSLLVGIAYLLARRVSHSTLVPPLVGLVLVFYYPLISLGGYTLSEIPFSFCLVSSTFFLVRMAQDGRSRDAWAAGTFAALGFVIRPQILASIGLLGLFWLVARRWLPRLRLTLMLQALVPLLLIAGFSAYRLHHHTGRMGLISENGKFNQVFGRCHNNKIKALPDTPSRRITSFGPPPLIQLEKREAKMPGAWPGLDPTREREIVYRGYIGDSEILGEIIDGCVEQSGWAKQVEYSLVNAMLLWRYNIMWPDSGKSFWREHVKTWGMIHTTAFAVPALLALFAVFLRRRAAGLSIVALHLWALLIIAVMILGGIRFRSPYDPFIVIMALEVYVVGSAWLVGLAVRFMRKARPHQPKAASS
ncbi:MAG: glycosyltransferase family 39 protein [Myxococcales bacterium]|nr:glycosyltransferase family 39 protein [Myxococcales bacterium]